MFHKDDVNKVNAYLQISCFIVGPNEKPPIHSQDEDFGEDQFQNDSDDDDEAIARKIESIKRAQGVMQVTVPSMIQKSYQISVMVAKSRHLIKINDLIQPFVSARVNGLVLRTNKKTKVNSEWNQKLLFPIFYPVLNNKITVRIWSETGMMSKNEFIANIPEHPGPMDMFNIIKLQSQDGRMKARWFHLYGTHPENRNDSTKSLTEGTQYLGSVLLALSLVTTNKPSY